MILGVQNATSWESAYLQVLGKISMRGRNESGFKRRSVSLDTHLRVLSFSGPREAFKICVKTFGKVGSIKGSLVR